LSSASVGIKARTLQKVTNGQVIKTTGECKEVKFKMKGLHMKLNFNLLELGGCGIVLGIKGVIGEVR
jgi:exosome complex RNA-binding protein Rrp4